MSLDVVRDVAPRFVDNLVGYELDGVYYAPEKESCLTGGERMAFYYLNDLMQLDTVCCEFKKQPDGSHKFRKF